MVQLSNTLDVVRKSLNGTTSRQERSKIGQFFTPAKIAQYMASLFQQEKREVRIIDTGAGTGVLFATLIETLIAKKQHLHSVEVTAYEIDKGVIPYLKDTMERCRMICMSAGISFRGEIRDEDFVAAAVAQTDEGLFAAKSERFTHAILNPPYKKINGESVMRQLLYNAGIEVSNLYAAFVWLTVRLLEPSGEIVAITPRSFCNGPYFRRFRAALLGMMSLRHIHVFESRKKAFGDDNVLQENVIFHAIKEKEKPDNILLSVSEGTDFNNAMVRTVPYDRIILPSDRDAFIHLMVSEEDNRTMELLSGGL